MDLKEQIDHILSDQLMDEIIALRRHFHQYPELSFQEHQTSSTIRELLDQWGVEYDFPFVETGIVATIKGEKPGLRIALRSDMDALPVLEQTELAFASQNPGVMHACGHDIHMASLLGSIRVLNQLKPFIEGEILFLFQPGEEKIPGGAKLMLEQGVFEGRQPDMIIAQHVLPEMESGHVGFRPGIYMASNDEIFITVKGEGGHAALRQDLKDPILMASHILIQLQKEITEKAPGHVPTVLSFGKVVANGATNVIPDQVQLEGTFRTMNETWRKEAHRLIEKVSSDIASGLGGSIHLEVRHGYPVLFNHEQITSESGILATKLLGSDRVEDMDIRMTAEDFAWFTQVIPGMMYRLGVRNPGSEQVYPLHTSRFMADETALKTGISVLSFLAVELLKKKPV
ncbi:MAG: amidohydrolase [Bacteroidia bacterium]|nr:MAG: amidohydrolase [Bacteroidia bacterium]